MFFPVHSSLSKGAQALAILLAVAVGLQGIPLTTLVHHWDGPETHQECSHERGYCPTNPDGPCECRHTEKTPDPPGEHTLTTCNGGDVNHWRLGAQRMWMGNFSEETPAPTVQTVTYTSNPPHLPSQRKGDEIFRPPRVSAPHAGTDPVGFAS